MGKEIRRSMNDALYNAGLLGFFKTMNQNVKRCRDEGDSISFDSDDLQVFTSLYFQELINEFGDDTAFAQIESERQTLLGIYEINEHTTKCIMNAEKLLSDKLKRNSYVAAFEILRQKSVVFDFEEAIRKIKDTDDLAGKRDQIIQFVETMQLNSEVFLLKDIAYTRIQPFWSSVAFLNKMENKSDFAETYTKSFTAPALCYLEELSTRVKQPKSEIVCCQCGEQITKGQASSMSWINNEGVDVNRKTSYYWNHQPDSFLCPICNLIYSCIPLGFLSKGDESIFVNQNASFRELTRFSSEIHGHIDEKQTIFYKVIQTFLHAADSVSAEKEISNIQIIRRKGDRYSQHILSKEMLSKLKKCNINLERLVGRTVKLGEDYYQLYPEIMGMLLKNSNLYLFINKCLHYSIEENQQVGYIKNLIEIQVLYFGKGEGKMEQDLVKNGYRDGFFLRQKMMGPDRNENKLKGLSFKLVNSLKSKDQFSFIDTVLRQYLSEGSAAPKNLISVFSDEDTFLDYGYSFLTGLNSYNSAEGSDEKNDVKVKEEEMTNA